MCTVDIREEGAVGLSFDEAALALLEDVVFRDVLLEGDTGFLLSYVLKNCIFL